MEFDSTPWSLDVLDLLFDDNSGLLKDDVNSGINRNGIVQQTFAEQNNNIHNFNFGDLDLFNENLFENFTHSTETDSLVYEPPDKKKVFHSDHDYIAHKSPSEHSDSGISVVSEDSSSVLRLSIDSDKSKTDDQLELSTPPGYPSPRTDHVNLSNNFSYADSKTYDMLSEQDTSIIMAAETMYDHKTDKLADQFDETGYTGNDDDISIDFDFDSLDSGLLSSDHQSRGTQSVLVLGVNKRVFPNQGSKKDMTLPFTVKDVDDHNSSCVNFPELHLSDEEKELLAREGVSLPTNLPLTRDEERVLKAVRRKIRNKISAKESRKRKQGYVEGLEQRIKHCTKENCDLYKKVDTLEKLNVSLIAQLKRLHSLVGKTKIHAQASTCAMVLLLSFALFIAPTLNPFGSTDGNHTPLDAGNTAVRGKARSLLEHGARVADGDDDPYGVSLRRSPPWEKQSAAQNSVLKFGYKAGQNAVDFITADSTPTEDASLKAQGKPGLRFLSRDIQIELAGENKDYTVTANRSYTGNLVADQI
jgi:hypothetical protein